MFSLGKTNTVRSDKRTEHMHVFSDIIWASYASHQGYSPGTLTTLRAPSLSLGMRVPPGEMFAPASWGSVFQPRWNTRWRPSHTPQYLSGHHATLTLPHLLSIILLQLLSYPIVCTHYSKVASESIISHIYFEANWFKMYIQGTQGLLAAIIY